MPDTVVVTKTKEEEELLDNELSVIMLLVADETVDGTALLAELFIVGVGADVEVCGLAGVGVGLTAEVVLVADGVGRRVCNSGSVEGVGLAEASETETSVDEVCNRGVSRAVAVETGAA
jgi:hypothetical protein